MLWALKRHDAGNYRNFVRIIDLARIVGGVLDRWAASSTSRRGSAIWALAVGIELHRAG